MGTTADELKELHKVQVKVLVRAQVVLVSDCHLGHSECVGHLLVAEVQFGEIVSYECYERVASHHFLLLLFVLYIVIELLEALKISFEQIRHRESPEHFLSPLLPIEKVSVVLHVLLVEGDEYLADDSVETFRQVVIFSTLHVFASADAQQDLDELEAAKSPVIIALLINKLNISSYEVHVNDLTGDSLV